MMLIPTYDRRTSSMRSWKSNTAVTSSTGQKRIFFGWSTGSYFLSLLSVDFVVVQTLSNEYEIRNTKVDG